MLYQIVRSAEQFTDVDTLPFRAIFAAYESILPKNGLDPDHDQIYLRFLFRLGDRRAEGQSLYQSFEALLEELGFQIEIVPDEDIQPEITRNIDILAQLSSPTKTPKRSRRASLEPVFNDNGRFNDMAGLRPSSRASMSRLDVSQRFVTDVRPSTRATTRKTERTNSLFSPLKATAAVARRDRLTDEQSAEGVHHIRGRHRSLSSEWSESSVAPAMANQISPKTITSTRTRVRQRNTGKDHITLEESSDFSPQQAYPIELRDRLYNPSRTQLLRDAETFHHYRIRSVAREIVDKWCYAALQVRNHHEHLDRLAAAQDTEILLRQAFENWRARLHAKKLAAETERYFESQERKVQRSHNLMLMDKAFSHWLQCTLEEHLRTKNARQQIVGTKYLHIWRDITIKNQRNVRQQGLRKFFGIWKQQCIRKLTDNIKADFVRQEILCRNAYWLWFWAFCERRAPEWRASRLRTKYVSLLLTIYHNRERQRHYATMHSAILIRARVLSQWVPKTRIMLEAQRKASNFDAQKQALYALRIWKRNNQHAPMLRQVSNMVDWRVAGATFGVFVARFRYEQQAAAINRLRIMRNAWTEWNDRLRWHTVAHRIDDRYCLEALYKWVIAGRCLLLQRLRDERLKQRFLTKLHDLYNSNASQRAQIYQVVEDTRKQRSLGSFLTVWHARLASLRSDQWVSDEFYSPKALQSVLQLWIQRSSHTKLLNGWVKHVQFYLLGKRMIKQWQAATAESKRRKRKIAYVQIRRKVKTNLARGTLRKWHDQLTQFDESNKRADSAYQIRLLDIGATLFDSWNIQIDTRRDYDDQASWHYSIRLIERFFYTWVENVEERIRIEGIAELNQDMRVKNLAFGWFNKLRLRIIELKGQEANAENLRNWYEKRRIRHFLRRWQDKTVNKLNPQEGTTVTPHMTRTRLGATSRSSLVERAEEWTEFDIGDWIPASEAQSNTTPLPGYLSTPSKRAARARALATISTTPAGTPFEQHFRPQKLFAPRTTRRAAFGKSVSAMKGGTFDAIIENSPRTPDVGKDR